MSRVNELQITLCVYNQSFEMASVTVFLHCSSLLKSSSAKSALEMICFMPTSIQSPRIFG